MTPSPAIAPPSVQQSRKRLGRFIGTMNLRLGFMGFVTLGNAIILLSLIWMSIDVLNPLGVLRPLIEEAGLPREGVIGFFAILFGVDVAQMRQTKRRQAPGYGALTSLSGQLILALVSAVYVIKGVLPPIALYGTWGVFLLSLVGMLVVIQSYQGPSRYIDAKQLMYPVLSLTMGILLFGLIWPGSAISVFILEQWNLPVKIGLVALLVIGCGELKQNHLTPDQVVTRIGGLFFFAFFSLTRFAQDRDASLLATWMNVMVYILALFLAFIQAQDYSTHPTQDTAG